MLYIPGRNINQIFPLLMMFMREKGEFRDSRNGPTLELNSPLTVRYFRPEEQVLFNARRRINPFLHFFEPLWLLAGRKDVKFLREIVDRFIEYSDDGYSFFSSYGDRLRHPRDQISRCIEMIKTDEDNRRVVGVIRRPEDLWAETKDQSCNCMFTCRVRKGKLDMHVFNRSNDLIWGLAGTNLPQFSVLQQYIAAGTYLPVGELYQITTCPHVYLTPQWKEVKDASLNVIDPYSEGDCAPYDMFGEGTITFDLDLHQFFIGYDGNNLESFSPQSRFFGEVVMPMWRTFKLWKAKEYEGARKEAESVKASDWKLYLQQYMEQK